MNALSRQLKQGLGMKGIKVRKESGVATVEFALIAVVFFTIVFGIIEFGIILFNQHVLTNASREGARAGVVMRTPRLSKSEIETKINDYAKEYMITFGPPHNLDFGPWPGEVPSDSVDPPDALRVGQLFGTDLTIKVKYKFEFLFFPWTKDLTAITTMKME